MALGQINAGSSVALTQVAGELAGILAKLQQEQTKASSLVAEAQGAAANSAATSTINSAQDQANQLKCDIALSGVQVATGAFSMVTSIRASNAIGSELKISDTQVKKLNEMKDNLTAKVDVNAGDLPPLSGVLKDSSNRTTLDNHEKNMQLLSQGKHPEHEITRGQAAALEESQRAKILRDIDRYLGTDRVEGLARKNAERRITEHDASQGRKSKFADSFQAASKMLTTGFQSNYVNDKGKDDALQQVQSQASNMLSSSFQQMVDARAKLADEIAQILGAKNAAIQAVVSSQG